MRSGYHKINGYKASGPSASILADLALDISREKSSREGGAGTINAREVKNES